MAGGTDYENYLMFNPEGKIKQLDNIKRTTELGNTCLALANKKFGVLIAHMPKKSRLAEEQKKIFKINDKTLFAFSGITNDGLSFLDFFNTKAIAEDVLKDRSIHYLNIFDDICYDAVFRSLLGNKRLFGIAGILMMDYNGLKIVEFEPAGLVRETIGSAIGNRCQSCKTILEKEHENFNSSSAEELIQIGIRALKNAHPDNDGEKMNPEEIHIQLIESGVGIKKIDATQFLQ